MGGDGGSWRSDVWRSTDEGASWTMLHGAANWAPRSFPADGVIRREHLRGRKGGLRLFNGAESPP